MRSLKLALLTTVALAAFASAAAAADLIVDVPMEEPIIDNSFSSFDGAYIGAFIQGQTAPAAFGIGGNFGVNALMDNLLIGGELSGYVGTGITASVQGTVKLGGLISDDAIIYGYTGLGSAHPTSYYVPVGIGAEVAVAENVSVKGELQYNFDLTGDPGNVVGKVGLNFHF
jgi:opacity protein-like surface antigen